MACTYTVGPVFTGFDAPVTDGVNLVQAGRTIPLKWRTTDALGAPIDDPAVFGSLLASTSACSTGMSVEEVSLTATGGTGLTSLGNGYWQFNWATNKSWSKKCREVRLFLNGAEAPELAEFQFR